MVNIRGPHNSEGKKVALHSWKCRKRVLKSSVKREVRNVWLHFNSKPRKSHLGVTDRAHDNIYEWILRRFPTSETLRIATVSDRRPDVRTSYPTLKVKGLLTIVPSAREKSRELTSRWPVPTLSTYSLK